MGSGKASLLLVISSPGIRKTILLLRKNVKLVKYVQWYGVARGKFVSGAKVLAAVPRIWQPGSFFSNF